MSGKAKERYIVLAGDSVIVCKIVKGQKYQIDVIIPVTELQLKTEKRKQFCVVWTESGY